MPQPFNVGFGCLVLCIFNDADSEFLATVLWKTIFLKLLDCFPTKFSPLCLILASEPLGDVPFIPNHDATTCYLSTCLHAEWFKHVFLEQFTDFTVFSCSCRHQIQIECMFTKKQVDRFEHIISCLCTVFMFYTISQLLRDFKAQSSTKWLDTEGCFSFFMH